MQVIKKLILIAAFLLIATTSWARPTRFVQKFYASTVSFLPTDISGLSLWLDADDATTITIATGVSQWDDKSGVGNDVSQLSASLQPA